MAYSKSGWRSHCAPIIARVLRENEGKTEQQIMKALREAYPYGEFAHHPYKIWRDEVRVQMGKKLPVNMRGPAAKRARQLGDSDAVANLFEEHS